MSELLEEQKFSRENFRGLIKIRENRKSFLTVKLLSFTVFAFTGAYLHCTMNNLEPNFFPEHLVLLIMTFCARITIIFPQNIAASTLL